MPEPLIARAEVVAPRFSVGDIATALARIERLLEEDAGEEKAAKAERTESEAHRAGMLADAQRTRELAERAQAKLDAASCER